MDPLLSQIRDRRGPEAATLDEYLAKAGHEAWNRLRDVARRSPEAVTDEAVECAARRAAEAPGSFFALLLDLAARNPARRERLVLRFRELMPLHPGPALGAAGYNLHEYQAILDEGWITIARDFFDHNPEGAWGIVESAAMYQKHLVTDAIVDAFEPRRAAMPRDYFVTMFSLPGRLDRALLRFDEHPAEAVDAAAFAAIHTPELVAAVLRNFKAAPEKAWEFFEAAARTRPELFDAPLLDALTPHGPGTLFSILRHLLPGPGILDRYVALLRCHPAKGIDSARYAFQGDDIMLVTPELVRALCEGFEHAAYPAYEFLHRLLDRRPELIGPPEIEAAIRGIPHATNYAFGFFRELLQRRPEFTREGTLAVFECLAQEPAYRAFVRAEELEGILAVSEAAHVRTGLEKALREPPRMGSRRARALMAILFREKLRARRHVLLEALRYASGIVLWRDSEKYSPVWEFLFFIIDHAADDAVSTAAAERFLEGAFQLHYLCRSGAEHDAFLKKLDLANPPPAPFPPGTRFLEAELGPLHSLVLELGRRFESAPRLAPLEAFAKRIEAGRTELRAIEGKPGVQERRRKLSFQIACWTDPGYAGAFDDPAAEARLSPEAQTLLRREKKDLAKHLRDTLRGEAIRIALAAVDRSRMELYRLRLRDVLGRDVVIEEVEPKILPSFLWFQAIGTMPNNRKGLKRLIEDRIAGRPHDWLRTEPAALAWAERVRACQPGVHLDAWRAPFTKEVQYRPKDALAEKRRRIKADLAQARALLEKAGAKGIGSETYEELAAAFEGLRTPPVPEEGKPARPAADPALLQEVSMNLERARIAEQTPDSDFEGRITLSVESDPFEILFMGEYGFASCLSLRGSNAWSAVSNAVDVDKTVVWAKEPGGNVVGRRLLALTPEGVVMFRTYVNRHGLALDGAFDAFVQEYARHCGTKVARGGRPGPLLSDRWYDDGAL